jgi:ketosteroid isomerase-like protein
VSANLDLVRSIYAAWERGDFGSNEWAHPEIEFVVADGPEPGRWTGRDGMSVGNRTILDDWEGIRLEPEEYRELDDEHVLVLIRHHGRGKTSGLEIGKLHSKGANVFHLRGGKVTRIVVYFEREHALAELGFAPESDAADALDQG